MLLYMDGRVVRRVLPSAGMGPEELGEQRSEIPKPSTNRLFTITTSTNALIPSSTPISLDMGARQAPRNPSWIPVFQIILLISREPLHMRKSLLKHRHTHSPKVRLKDKGPTPRPKHSLSTSLAVRLQPSTVAEGGFGIRARMWR